MKTKRMSGDIDTNSLYKYKFNDNIFRKDEIKSRCKNNSVIILIDLSGSMRFVIDTVIARAYDMYKFCKLEKIPILVIGFTSTDEYSIEQYGNIFYFFEKDDDFSHSNFPMSGTPLTKSIKNLFDITDNFIKQHKTEKNTFVVITDGECDGDKESDDYRYKNSPYIVVANSGNTYFDILSLYKQVFDLKVFSIRIFNEENKDYVNPVSDYHINITTQNINDINKMIDYYVRSLTDNDQYK
jgi:hypothetical protein